MLTKNILKKRKAYQNLKVKQEVDKVIVLIT